MNLAIINGSPRRNKSNSKILVEHFLAGFRTIDQKANISTSYLSEGEEQAASMDAFRKASTVIIIFPLYTDAMPGIAKEFLEKVYLEKYNEPKKVGFIVQSGFPEAIHSVTLERYLEKYSRRLGFTYLGTVIKGGVEGIQVMPPWMTKKIFSLFHQQGAHFATTGQFSEKIMAQLKGPLRMSKLKMWGFKWFSKTNMANFYWNSHLKKYGAWEKRFDKPFEKETATVQ